MAKSCSFKVAAKLSQTAADKRRRGLWPKLVHESNPLSFSCPSPVGSGCHLQENNGSKVTCYIFFFFDFSSVLFFPWKMHAMCVRPEKG